MLVASWPASPAACRMGVSAGSMLPDLLVDVGVEHSRICSQVGLEREDLVLADELLNRVVLDGVFQVAEDARVTGTDFDTRWLKPARDAVVAQRAFFCRPRVGIHETAPIGAGLDAETAADAVSGINENGAIGAIKRSADRASLRAGDRESTR